jgi:Zn-finger nucleic acid-binding protein
MKCPVDERELVMSERQGIEIDYCPTCRGVWLDRGELDKLIDRSAATTAPPDDRGHRSRDDDRDLRDGREDRDGPRRKKKKESFLSELFEFGG